jgi:hypothetical protein
MLVNREDFEVFFHILAEKSAHDLDALGTTA